MATIIPAILTKDSVEVQRMLNELRGLAEWAQIDCMDDTYIPDETISPSDLGELVTTIKLEADLMVADPISWLQYLVDAQFGRAYFHLEAVRDPIAVIHEYQQARLPIGVAIKAETPTERIEPFLPDLEAVQFMGVDPGAQGRPFYHAVIAKIRKFHRVHPRVTISVDGGVNGKNIHSLVLAGGQRLCIGSALFAQGAVHSNFQKLQSLIA